MPPYKLAEDRGVEPHPISENLVFKASRRTIPAALSSIVFLAGEMRFELMILISKTSALGL